MDRRSEERSNWAVAVVACLMLACLAGEALGATATPSATTSAATRATTRRAARSTYDFPTFGVAVELGSQWRTLTHWPVNQVCKWVLAGEDLRSVRAAITIDIEPLSQRSLQKYATDLATKLEGTVAGERPTIAGRPGLRIELKAVAKPDVVHPVQLVVVENHGHFYVLGRWETAGALAADDFKTLLQTLRWREVEPPTKHLSFRKSAFPLFNLIFMNAPAIARSVPVKDAGTQFHMAISDHTAGRPEFFMNVDLVPTDGGKTLEQIAAEFGKRTATQVGLKAPIALAAREGRPARVVSPWVEVRPPGAPASARALIQWAILQIDARRLAMVMFTLPAERPEKAAIYQKVAEHVLDSITPAAAERRTTAPAK